MRVLHYQTDLAYVHDTGFGDFSRNAAPGLLEMLRRKGIHRGLVIDLGCGSGIWARALTQAGYEVLGIDISSAMIQLARRKAPLAKFKIASLLRCKLPSCVAITSLGECLNYQFDRHTKIDLITFFERVYSALQPGGVFIFDIAEPGYVHGTNPQRTYVEGKGWAILLQKEEDRRQETLMRTMTIFRKVGRLYRRSEEVHRVQLYRGNALAKELRKVGFIVKLIRGYGELRFRKAVVGVLAVKP
ncbi:methyltransferase domain-containing protein [candidate division KSB1 bacterium]|nr:methyltransferase domain-containing protein [candidate division KSB1 bacterium]